MEVKNQIFFGGDYNPEQWNKEIWDTDMKLFKKAGISIVTINVFSWTLSQSSENCYDFSWLDEVVEKLKKSNIYICMATGSAAVPAWMVKKYPEVLSVDFQGRRNKFGKRHNFCPNSIVYRKMVRKMVSELADHYKDEKSIIMWHVNNEYGNRCYCEQCKRSFVEWLKHKYGNLDSLNEAWYTRFWNHTFLNWNEIELPNLLSEHIDVNNIDKTSFPSISLDYDRFNSESFLECFKLEKDAIKKYIPKAIVTTNFQGNGTYKPLNYFEWAKYVDVVSLDMYPDNNSKCSYMALRYDLIRSLKNGQSFQLMESSPSTLNWRPQNPLKRPGVNRLQGYQALAHGANSIMYFQLRKSRGAFEKFHGALIDHDGTGETRVFKECEKIGKEIKIIKHKLYGTYSKAKVAIVIDWENWWAIDHSSGPSDQINYWNEIQRYYDVFYQQNITVDFLDYGGDFDKYEIIITPNLYMIHSNVDKKIKKFVTKGGTLIASYFSGIVDENDLVTLGGYPGLLKDVLGIWVEEWDALEPKKANSIKIIQEENNFYRAEIMCELIHCKTAKIYAKYDSDFYKGSPAVTSNIFGKGIAWYVGTSPEQAFLDKLIKEILEKKNIVDPFPSQSGVEITSRYRGSKKFYFIINYNDYRLSIPLSGIFKNMFTNSIVTNQIDIESNDIVILQDEENFYAR